MCAGKIFNAGKFKVRLREAHLMNGQPVNDNKFRLTSFRVNWFYHFYESVIDLVQLKIIACFQSAVDKPA